MKKAFNLSLLSLGVLFLGCSDSNVGLVKNGTLELDKSLTVGQAIDNYKFFKKTRWEPITTDNGKKVVLVRGDIDTDKHPRFNAKGVPDLKSMEMQFQFRGITSAAVNTISCVPWTLALLHPSLLQNMEQVQMKQYSAIACRRAYLDIAKIAG